MDTFHPDILRDDLDRAWLWDNLWNDVPHRPIVECFIESELKQADKNDIPHFKVRVDSNDIKGGLPRADCDGYSVRIGVNNYLHPPRWLYSGPGIGGHPTALSDYSVASTPH